MKKIFKKSKVMASSAMCLTTLLISTSCSSFMPDRSFIEEMNRESDPYLQAGKDFPVVSGDTGDPYRTKEEIVKRTPASGRTKKKRSEDESIRQELVQKEAEIPEEGVEQYTKDKKFLPNDSDKLYYLSLSKDDRVNYIKIKQQDMEEDHGKSQDFIQKHSIHSQEIYLGMQKDEVMKIWGKPSRVEIAGNPKNQNERWSFVEDGSVKQIYFESGKVQGWALDL